MRHRHVHHRHHLLPRRLRPRQEPSRPLRPRPLHHRRRHQALPAQGRPGVPLRGGFRPRLLAPVQAGGARPLRPPLELLLWRPQEGRAQALRRRLARRRRPLPRARRARRPLRRSRQGARQAQHLGWPGEAAAPHGDGAVQVPAGGVHEVSPGHGDVRAHPHEGLRLRR
uniref:Uncharacterized protein n=1 Tax=Triticum urartu TaxID=4572 RepID=A0A8R7RBU6_TRIUA